MFFWSELTTAYEDTLCYKDIFELNARIGLVGFTLSQATKALSESRGIALLYFRPLH